MVVSILRAFTRWLGSEEDTGLVLCCHLCPEMNAMAKMAKNRQKADDSNWMPKVAPCRVYSKRFRLVSGQLLAPFLSRALTLIPRYLLLNRTETLATQARPLGEQRFWWKRQFWRNWRFWQKWQKSPKGWRFKLDCRSGPLKSGELGENGKICKFGTNSEKSPEGWQCLPFSSWRAFLDISLCCRENLLLTDLLEH